jgi:hypothetical protein
MAFLFKLETKDGTPAEPPMLQSAVPNWREGDTIPLAPGAALRVVDAAKTCARGISGGSARGRFPRAHESLGEPALALAAGGPG